MEVRNATDADLSAIAKVAERSWEHDYPAVLSRETAVEGVHEWYGEETMRSELGVASSAVLVADRGAVVGFVHVAWTGDRGDVLRVYVDPAHRGEAVGSALLETGVATLSEREVQRIRAMVLDANDAGKAFYRAHGFKPEPETNETIIAGETYDERVFILER